MSSPLLSIQDVQHGYSPGVLSWGLDGLQLDSGQSAGCSGPSGSGKTTLLELLAGLQLPHTGAVLFQGKAWGTMSNAARQAQRLEQVGLVFQGFELLGALTVRENIALPMQLLNVSGQTSSARSQSLMELAGIAHLAGRKPTALSHGERQRVALCRALIHKPRLVLADEPTANLDPDNARAIIDVLLHTVREEGTALVCVTHDPALLPSFDIQWKMTDYMQGEGKARSGQGSER